MTVGQSRTSLMSTAAIEYNILIVLLNSLLISTSYQHCILWHRETSHGIRTVSQMQNKLMLGCWSPHRNVTVLVQYCTTCWKREMKFSTMVDYCTKKSTAVMHGVEVDFLNCWKGLKTRSDVLRKTDSIQPIKLLLFIEWVLVTFWNAKTYHV